MTQEHSNEEPESLKEILKSYGFVQPWRVRFWPFVLVVIVVAVYLGGLLAVELADVLSQHPSPPDNPSTAIATGRDSGSSSRGAALATAVLALGAFIVGYHQWRAARRETSMDRFYDRLEIANDRLAALEGIDAFHMYVYSELDNLEYVIEKYRLGYMSPEQALRGLRTFQSRLTGYKGQEFGEFAEGALDRSAYSPDTCCVVRRVLAKTERKES
jgi:hypothetical protein